MATQIQEHLAKSNEHYASSFTSGHLALPPAKKYLVCMIHALSHTERSYVDNNHLTPSQK